MARFGIIAEGITDQIVLEAILAGYFEDDDPDVAYIQPPTDDTGRGPAVGNAGWGMVFKQFETGKFADALDGGLRDYLVVQIDTDVSEQKGYDVPWREGDRELSPRELTERVVARLRRVAGEATFDKYRDKLIFAVCVHSIECWLLPLVYSDNKRSKITGCLDAVGNALKRKNMAALASGAGAEQKKFPRAYQEASRDFERHKVIAKAFSHNASFAMFVAELDARFPDRRVTNE